MTEKPHIAQLMLNARKQLGVSQKAMALKLDVTASALCRYERGSRLPTLTVINRIKVLLGGNAHDLLVNLID